MYSEKLFSYGTLQNEEIQVLLFGRILNGYPACIDGYSLSQIELVENEKKHLYPILSKSKNIKDKVCGKVFLVSKKELTKADEYETEAYARIKIKLTTELNPVWVYTSPFDSLS